MLRRVVVVLLFAAVLAAMMQAVRLLLIEPDEMAKHCALHAQQWQCQLRNLAVQGFARHLYGPISLGAAVLALFVNRWFAVLALIAGMAGVVLYDFELSALGLLLGALLLVRDRPAPILPRQHQPQ